MWCFHLYSCTQVHTITQSDSPLDSAWYVCHHNAYIREMFHEPDVEVLPSQVRVAVRRQDGELAALDRHDRDIERAATQVEYEDRPPQGRLLIQAVGDGRRGGLVDDGQHVQAGDLTCR